MRRTTSNPLSGRRVASLSLSFAAGLLAASALGCAAESESDGTSPRDAALPLQSPPRTTRVPAPLPSAYCDVTVTGVGTIDLESEYLPNVVRCENGGANLEALKAQAIAARSVAYYNMATEGEICDSQGCQVYSCGGEPNALQIQAVEETSGIYLMYNSTLTYGFYVAGDNNPAPPACVGVDGATATEHWVTYNSGQSGTDVEQTELGFVHPTGDPSYGQNRGCMSQWGARCLENDTGADYLDILRFYYGEDIELVQAEGECVTPPETTDGTSSTDDTSAEVTGGGDTTSDPGGDAETGIPPVESTTTDTPSDDSSGGVVSGGTAGPSEDDDVDPSAGSGGAMTEALPDGFGEDGGGGCGCKAPRQERRGAGWLALGLLGLLRLRSRRSC